MKTFTDYLNTIEDPDKRLRMQELLAHIKAKFPQLKEEIKWHQPMFSDHGTFIIGLSMAKNHISVAPESNIIPNFITDIEESGYSHTQGLFRVKWTDAVNYDLLDKMIAFTIDAKKGVTKFWG
ncbi:MAG: iron chaperone [Clostridiaceae bacterium]|nr:iron chaperone [Clostridiaceae bacterium]